MLKAYIDYIALGWCDHHTPDPSLALEWASIRGDELHARAGKREIERACVRHVREIEAHNLTATHRQPIPRLTVYQHHVAKPPHQRMGRCFQPERNEASIADQKILQHQDLFSIGGDVRAGLPHENVAIQAERLLDVFANVRMVPENPGIRELQFVCERVAYPFDSVERVLEPYAMPMNARRV